MTKNKKPASPISIKKEPEIILNKIELDNSPALNNQNLSLELSLLKDKQFDRSRSEISKMNIDENKNYTKKF